MLGDRGFDGFYMRVLFCYEMYGGSWNDGFFERIQFDEMEEIMEIKCDDLEKSKKQFTVAGVKKNKLQDTRYLYVLAI